MTYNDICNAPNHAGIYCFKNTVNGKCYIGQAVKLRSRLKYHWKAYSAHSVKNMCIYNAFYKYGIENFELQILYEIRDSLAYNTKRRLDQLEKEYIEKYDSYKNGYNQTLGGDGGILGYKFTDEQREKVRQNNVAYQQRLRQEKAKDPNNWIKCRNIETLETFVFTDVRQAGLSLEIPEYLIRKAVNKQTHVVYKRWQFCKNNEEFEDLDVIEDYGEFPTLPNKEEICDFIKSNPYCTYKDVKQQFELSRKTFYNYRNELGIKHEFRSDAKVQKEDFVSYCEDHTKWECMQHFKITERRYYKYKAKYAKYLNGINTMELKFKRLEDSAVLPIRSTKGAAGIDLTCIKIETALNEANQLMLVYHTGLAVEIPAGYVGLLIPRSSIWKKSLWLTDNVGVIDARILIGY